MVLESSGDFEFWPLVQRPRAHRWYLKLCLSRGVMVIVRRMPPTIRWFSAKGHARAFRVPTSISPFTKIISPVAKLLRNLDKMHCLDFSQCLAELLVLRAGWCLLFSSSVSGLGISDQLSHPWHTKVKVNLGIFPFQVCLSLDIRLPSPNKAFQHPPHGPWGFQRAPESQNPAPILATAVIFFSYAASSLVSKRYFVETSRVDSCATSISAPKKKKKGPKG